MEAEKRNLPGNSAGNSFDLSDFCLLLSISIGAGKKGLARELLNFHYGFSTAWKSASTRLRWFVGKAERRPTEKTTRSQESRR